MNYLSSHRNLVVIFTLTMLATWLMPHTSEAKTKANSKTYALIIANNGSVNKGVKPLRYADDDGARYHETFSHLADQTTLLTVLDSESQAIFPSLVDKTKPPTRRELAKQLESLKTQIQRDKKAGKHVEIYLVFTGHGHIDPDTKEGYLSLVDGKLTRKQLYRDVIAPLDADYTHLIIDACHAYFMVQSRGDQGDEWTDDRSTRHHDEDLLAYVQQEQSSQHDVPDISSMSTLGVILSTSGTAEVHEWSKLRAGVFSHQLRSALLGGADVDQDGDITYLEIEAFLAAANASVTNPKARINVFARPPAQDQNHALLSLSDYKNASLLELPQEQARYVIEDGRGLRYADINKAQDVSSSIVLLEHDNEPATYYLMRDEQEQAKLQLEQPASTITGNSLSFAQLDTTARSSVEESFRSELFDTPFGAGFYKGYIASRARYETLISTQQSARQVAMLNQEQPRWNVAPELGYTLSGSIGREIFNAQSAQHNLSFVLGFQAPSQLTIGPFVGYGFSSYTRDEGSAQIHRIALGADVGYMLSNEHNFFIHPRVRVAPQVVLIRDKSLCSSTGTCADPTGFRGELMLSLGKRGDASRIVSAMQLDLGLSMDVFSQAGITQNQETIYPSPVAGFSFIF